MLMNSGSIASLRRRVGLLDDSEQESLEGNPQVRGSLPGSLPPMAAPMGAPIPTQPPMRGPSSPQATSERRGLLSNLYNTFEPNLTRVQEELLSPEDQKRAKGGLLGRVAMQVLSGGLFTPSMQAQDRAKSMIAENDDLAQRRAKQAQEQARIELVQSIDWSKPEAAQQYVTGMLRIGAGEPQSLGSAYRAFAPETDNEMQVVGGSIYNKRTGQFLTPPSNSSDWKYEGPTTATPGRWVNTRTRQVQNVEGDKPLPWAPPQPQAPTILTGIGADGKPTFATLPRGGTQATPVGGITPPEKAGAKFGEVLPTVLAAIDRLKSYDDKTIDNLSSWGVNAASISNKGSDTPAGMLFAGIANQSGLVKPKDAEYAQLVRSVGDAVARAAEVGVLTNQDISRYESQVSFVAGDGPAMKRQKVKNAIAWAEWLARNKHAFDTGDKSLVDKMPGESEAEYTARKTGANPFRKR